MSDFDQQGERIDLEAFERARSVQTRLNELQVLASKANRPDLPITQAALIYRLQQDIYRVFGVNLATPEPFLTSREGVAIYTRAFEAVEKLRDEMLKFWIEKKDAGTLEGTVLGGMMTNACEFWITALFARNSAHAPLTLCVHNNHLIVAIVPKDQVVAQAAQYTNVFLATGDYALQAAHWPYVDVDQVVGEYEQIVEKDGSFADQFLRMLDEQSDDEGPPRREV